MTPYDDSDTDDTGDGDRPRAILSPVDRAWLTGEKEYDFRQLDYERRNAIRERYKHALLDLRLIFEHMDSKERQRVYDEIPASRLWTDAIEAGISLLYEASKPLGYSFASLASNAISAVEPRDQRVELSIEPAPEATGLLATAIEKIRRQQWDGLTPEESLAFIQHENLSPEHDVYMAADIQERIRERERKIRDGEVEPDEYPEFLTE